MAHRISKLLVFLLTLFVALTCVSQVEQMNSVGSTYVPLDSWVYPAIDKLTALGHGATAFSSMRPWTRVECARIVRNAGKASQPIVPEAQTLLSSLRGEFAPELAELGGLTTPSVELESLYTRFTVISGPPLRDSFHFGQTIVNDYGRPYAEGFNSTTGLSARASRGRFAAYVRGEFNRSPASTPYSDSLRSALATIDGTAGPASLPKFDSANQFRFIEAYGTISMMGWNTTFGKQSLWWGQARSGSLMFSNNAEPITMLRLSRSDAFKLPSVLGWLGPIRMEAFMGRLQGHSYPAHPWIHGEKFVFKPTENLELGFSRTVVFGGEGRPFTFNLLYKSYFSVGGVNNSAGFDAGDRHGGFDFSYRVPGLRKWLVIYSDSLSDDDPSPLAAPRRAAMNPGIYLPQIPKLPKLDFRAEYAYTDLPSGRSVGGRFIYWNTAYRDSYTNDGNLIGSWVGREGRGLHLSSTYWFSPQKKIQASYRNATVSGDFLPGGESLHNFNLGAEWMLKRTLGISAQFQYERWTAPLLASGRQQDVTTSVQLTYWIGKKWKGSAQRRDADGVHWKAVPVEDVPFKKTN